MSVAIEVVMTWAIRSSPPASSSPSTRPSRGRSPGPGARRCVVSSISWMISGSVVGRRSRRAGQRVAAERAEAHAAHHRASRRARSGMRSSSTMISVPSRSTTGRWRGEVERHDRDVLEVDVLPDVELGPVRQREHPDRSRPGACGRCRGCQSSGRWFFGSQRCCAERNEKMRSLARLFSSSRRAPPKAASKPYLSSACFRPCGLPHVGVHRRAVVERVDALRDAPPGSGGRAAPCRARAAIRSRNSYMSWNFQVVSTCSSGNGGLAGIEGLARQVQHHARCPCRSNRASPAARTRPPPRA